MARRAKARESRKARAIDSAKVAMEIGANEDSWDRRRELESMAVGADHRIGWGQMNPIRALGR